ncbi:HAE1 family hydrophobic/amphiphilic exporter-1 [Agromyces terreus]|uniref:HAE1 family hydrophobic/amphiphilic exporter-1 n=1 Tax=Agromyces terreus TaxID=424795 RepID=A0A9X2H139_9MICO|nr:efflux RND transporter permease subunit [Agromyces terreus]MCP2370685.1 HAE1 family hydrophobic/amphiphilic exporter-1 [Agromyces terreus]
MSLLAALSMKNRALIALVTVVVAIFGGISLTSLKQELAPSISFPQLMIVTAYPGASPDVVNTDVSTPVETAIQGITGLEDTTTTSSTGVSRVTASFTYGTDLAYAEQKLLSSVNRISSQLPDDVDPQVFALSLDDFPVLQIAVTGADDPTTLSDEITRTTLGEIKDVDGVRDATLVGDTGQRVTITPDAAKLAAYGLTSQAVGDALAQNGVLIPAGSITEGDKTYSVQTGTRIEGVDDLAALPVLGATEQQPVPGADAATDALPDGTETPDGTAAPDATATPDATAAPATISVPVAITIGDVASVEVTENPVTSISRVNGEPALTIQVTKLPAANTVDVSNAVTALLPDLQASLDSTNPGAEFTVVFDQAPYIQQSIESLATEGLLGLAFAVIVILLFLMSVRATLVTAISIPTSVLITFIGLQATGYTLNILTLGALTIAIGRVVDDSIVVIENIKRHLVVGVDKASTIVHAVREVAGAITASTITTVAVFLPIALVEGVTGELFRPFSLTVTIALLASLLVSLTIVPVLAYWFLKPARVRAKDEDTEPGSDAAAAAFIDETGADAPDELEHPSRLQRGYLPIIAWTLKHSVVTIMVAVLVLGGTIAMVPLMKTNFLGSSGQNTFQVTQELPVGSSLDTMDEASQPVEDAIRGTSGVETVQTSIGSGSGSLASLFGSGGATVTYSITTDEDADQEALQAEVREELDGLSDVGEVTLTASSGFGASSDIAVNISASNAEDLQKATDAVVDEFEGFDSLTQVSSNLSESREYIAIEVDRDAAAEAGYSEVALGGYVSAKMSPQTKGSIVVDEQTLTIYIADENPPTTIEELQALEIPTAAGLVRLDSLATVETVDGPTSITTVQGLRSATVTATPASDDLTAANADVAVALAEVDLPAGTSAEIGGVSADQAESFSQLGLALLAAILIVYIVMVATFRSLLQPLLLLVSVPFAATGAIALQVATGVPLGVPSLIGVLMLVGIVVTNAIVLVDLVNQYRDRGMNVRDALVHGASRRLRPILMTALATIFALVPMALGITGHGGFISQPLAIVVIGGLLSSTVLTLVVLPVLYNLVEGGRERRAAKRAERADAPSAAEAEQRVTAGEPAPAGGPAPAEEQATAEEPAPAEEPEEPAEPAPAEEPAPIERPAPAEEPAPEDPGTDPEADPGSAKG